MDLQSIDIQRPSVLFKESKLSSTSMLSGSATQLCSTFVVENGFYMLSSSHITREDKASSCIKVPGW